MQKAVRKANMPLKTLRPLLSTPKPRVLIIGARGNMGRRYAAVCRYLGYRTILIDIGDTIPSSGYSRAIVATPIDAHFQICRKLIEFRKPFLCEKPISRNEVEVRLLARLCETEGVAGHMVCNWAFVLGDDQDSIDFIRLDYYNTGRDGAWDYIQPVYLCDDFQVKHNSPVYKCLIARKDASGRWVDQVDFDRSYIRMLQDWLNDGHRVWTMRNAVEADEKLRIVARQKRWRLP